MTFDEAREVIRVRLETAFVSLRRVVSDPAWCNDAYKPYRESVEAIGAACRAMMRLNEAELEAKR